MQNVLQQPRHRAIKALAVFTQLKCLVLFHTWTNLLRCDETATRIRLSQRPSPCNHNKSSALQLNTSFTLKHPTFILRCFILVVHGWISPPRPVPIPTGKYQIKNIESSIAHLCYWQIVTVVGNNVCTRQGKSLHYLLPLLFSLSRNATARVFDAWHSELNKVTRSPPFILPGILFPHGMGPRHPLSGETVSFRLLPLALLPRKGIFWCCNTFPWPPFVLVGPPVTR